ncbi:helix-turn-helix transcriptional regulator [Streptomyces sp. NPDC005840]|uniref:Helix-turn-helix transcriptional regulator n=1 Tax=Streptomyces doudnae TaxID=3075536 RepID=A0ABD5EXM7_9ACTN|nr:MULTISPECIES: helix-turn-helix transcriptional regulator [unclassified Streptomyces]MDT0439516.1 helix-turn-helix transcriptional regulator [Streptomyces sp. DSM 41981]MYQ69251.1 helix-turn-helix domain-containing protein [Streptomyces sp. SID4950]SCE52491.1 Helix-turn-helix domain-containing protein [Streptomyces sp. SolWspMP-5a-2]
MTHPYARELGDFLRARRGRLRPQDVGLEPGGRRRVTGLRREELALLAGLSTDYYQRMEQGREVRPSDPVLDALADALGLDDEERRHLFALARAARRPVPVRADHGPQEVPRGTLRLLGALDTPAVVLGRHLDLLAWNPLAEALLGSPAGLPPDRLNMLLLMFDDTLTGERSCPGWERQAMDYISMMRSAVAADPTHPRADALIGELTLRSAEFRRLWARHDVASSVSGAKTFRVPEVGDIALDWDTYPVPGRPGAVVLVYTAEPGSADAERLRLLASLRAPGPAPGAVGPAARVDARSR